jgi:hypothetical protein
LTVIDVDKDRTVSKALRDMTMFGLISEESSGEVRKFIEAVYVAGWEERGNNLTAHHEKKVIEYDQFDKPIAEYKSVADAAKKKKCSPQGIYSAIDRKSKTKLGHTWKYA